MSKPLTWTCCVALTVTTARALAAEAAGGGTFAAAASAPATATPGFSSLAQVSLALVFVLGLVFALAWLLRRMRGTRRPGAPGLDILAELAFGQKERAVLVQVGRTRLLLGVASGQVRTLHVLSEADAATDATAEPPVGKDAAPDFGDLLRRSLGR